MAADATTLAAACRGVGRTYHTSASDTAALVDVDVEVDRGSLCVLAGPSGSGKSTLLRLFAVLDRPDRGDVEIDGVALGRLGARARRRQRRTKIGYVFQQPMHNLLPYLTAAEHVDLAAQLRGAARGATDGVLARVGLEGRADHRPGQLSGGEQQRLGFAMAVVGDPPVVVADEPTADLDRATGAELIADLDGLRRHGATLIVASHDDAVLAAADRVVYLDFGRGPEVVG